MATVRFSGELVDAIRNNARETFDSRIRKAAEVDPTIGDRMYDHAFKDYYPKMNALPREFFEQCDAIACGSVGTISTSVQLRFSSSRPIPRAYPPNFKFRPSWSNTNINYVVDGSDPIDVQIETYFKERHERIQQINKQRDEFVSGVMKVCESFTTLAPALKAWPPLWDLIPESYRQRHLEMTERKSAADKREALNEINLGSLTATVVASKLVR